MLSFMRDQGSDSNQDSSKEEPAAADGQKGPEGAGEQEYIAVAPVKRQAQKSTVIVAVLFCIGLVCLGVMIKKSSPQIAGAAVNEEAQIELALSRFGGS